MSSSNYCFLTCMQMSQEASQVVCYSHLFKNFPQFFVVHIVKGFGIGNKAEVDFFWNALAFLMIQQMWAIWCLVPLPFLNPVWTSGNSWFTYCRNLAWRILSITLQLCGMSVIVQQFEHSLALPFFGIGMKTDLFQSCGHWWVFQICWHIECSTFTASSFRIWNSSTGILSLPLTLFIVMLPKAHLLCIPGCLALDGWSHHRVYLGHEDLFVSFFYVFCVSMQRNRGKRQTGKE